MNVETRLREMGHTLPPPPAVMGVYKPIVQVGNLAHLSGHLPMLPSGDLIRGRLGDDMGIEDGYRAAQQAGLAMLATLQAHCEKLDRVVRLVKTVGLVQCTPSFTDHPAVINGFSELMRDLFGDDHGIAARTAFGTQALPGGVAVEIEAIFELRPANA